MAAPQSDLNAHDGRSGDEILDLLCREFQQFDFVMFAIGDRVRVDRAGKELRHGDVQFTLESVDDLRPGCDVVSIFWRERKGILKLSEAKQKHFHILNWRGVFHLRLTS